MLGLSRQSSANVSNEIRCRLIFVTAMTEKMERSKKDAGNPTISPGSNVLTHLIQPVWNLR